MTGYRHKVSALFLFLLPLGVVFPCAAELSSKFGECVFTLSGKYRPESFFADNLNDLNKYNTLDRYIYAQHVLDVNFDAKSPTTELFMSLRNKAVWGNPESIAKTTSGETELLEGVRRAHTHALPRNFPWIRELWLQFSINEPFALPINDTHRFTVGAFPFQVGRGIALGDAYAVGPGYLGFYTDSAINQYAYGAMFDGDCIPGIAHYALYTGLLQNKTASVADNSKLTRLHESGRFDSPERGFGHVHFVSAAKLNWELFNGACGRLAIEPYALYMTDPEQSVEFPADSSNKMGTLGIASEYYGPLWEGGFDCAFNIGRQRIRPWDRNKIEVENRGGQIIMVNTHVFDAATKKRIPFVPGGDAQKIIVSTNRAPQSEALNGKDIGTVTTPIGVLLEPPVTLQNAPNRFRNGSCNALSGWMFVTDALYHAYPKCLSFGATVGVASGDANPNLETTDCHYKGFISIQEAYTGKRVKSAIVLPGRVVRPLGVPSSTMLQAPSKYPSNVSGFSNLIFSGTTVNWSPCCFKGAVSMRPNLLWYWQYDRTNKYDASLKREINCYASRYLGLEANIFMDYSMRKNLRLFGVLGLFFPGKHFSDIKGKPLNAAQARKLESFGIDSAHLPNISDNMAYMVNIAIETYF